MRFLEIYNINRNFIMIIFWVKLITIAEGERVIQLKSILRRLSKAGGVSALGDLSFESAQIQTSEQMAAINGKVEEGLREYFKKFFENQGLKGDKLKKAVDKAVEESMQEFRNSSSVPSEALSSIKDKVKTLTGAKERSDYASINVAGGDEKYREILANKSSINMAKEVGNVQQFMDLINNPKALNKILDQLEKAHMDVSNLRGKTGLDFLKALGAAKALYFGGSNAIVGADGKLFQSAVTPDGRVGGTVKGGLNTIIDDSFKKKEGQTYEGQLRKGIHDGIKNFLTTLGVDPETANKVSDGIIAGWNEIKDGLVGASTVSVTYWGKKWLDKKFQSSMRSPTNNSTDTLDAKNTAD